MKITWHQVRTIREMIKMFHCSEKFEPCEQT
jgi:hypothetical protein